MNKTTQEINKWFPKIDIMLEKLTELNIYLHGKGIQLINLNADSGFVDCEIGDYESAVI